MADAAELAFAKNHLNIIGSLPVQYPDEYQQPPQNSLKKLPIIPVDLPPPPAHKTEEEATPAETLTITFKSTKPPRSFTIPVSSADTISTVKAALAAQPGAPPADAQRLLLRGKALADGKLLREYPVKAGDTVNVMLRPGFDWDWNVSAGTAAKASGKDKDGDVSMLLDPSPSATPHSSTPGRSTSRRGSHARIPSVVLSPSPNMSSTHLPLADQAPPANIALTLDTSNTSATDNPRYDVFQKRIAAPEFWDRLYGFLKIEFGTPEDADNAFETFLVASKGNLTPSEIAKIRDTVGIMGMGGT